MAKQPCDRCGELEWVESKFLLSFSVKKEDVFLCSKCKSKIREMILKK